jgi:hypothetical protein
MDFFWNQGFERRSVGTPVKPTVVGPLGPTGRGLQRGALEHVRKWRRTKARVRPNSMVEQRKGLPRTMWRGFSWWLACNWAPLAETST